MTELAVWACGADACRTGGVAVTTPEHEASVDADAAVRPDGSMVVAHTRPERGATSATGLVRLSLTFCRAPDCGDPRTVTVTRRFPGDTIPRDVLLTPDGRAVVTVTLPKKRGLTVIACDTAACRDPHLATLGADLPLPPERVSVYPTADIAIRADGRPVVLYRETLEEGDGLLLDCLTPTCARHEWIRLPAASAMTVDRSGRVLVAGTPAGGDRLMLTTCRDARCVTSRLTPATWVRDDLAWSVAP
ncbi:hypothetical protein [Nonomuraea diastatica]|uniref:hypothetical protein n=1 Tax=Nonomuraea diastatica TaxID=1848329 RepID=UPI00140AE6D5|nr:hypothetical protein [Nonomuraea diastatica]